MAEDIMRLAKHLNLSKFHLMGHSMGGKTVMTFAVKYPELLDKLVVVDMSPYSVCHDFPIMRECMKIASGINFDPTIRITLSEARKIADVALKVVCTDAAVRSFVVKNLAIDSKKRIYWKPNFPVLIGYTKTRGTFPENLLSKRFDNHTLFIRGEKSPYVPDEDVPKIKKIFPNSRIDTIENSGHWPYADNLSAFLASLLSFLKS